MTTVNVISERVTEETEEEVVVAKPLVTRKNGVKKLVNSEDRWRHLIVEREVDTVQYPT